MYKNVICGIYKIENMVNGKSYIGQSNNIYNRWAVHRYDFRKGKTNVIYRAMRKYGIKNFKFEIIHKCEEFELNDWEIYFIEIYKSYVNRIDSNGYNETIGGDGCNGRSFEMSEEQKEIRRNKMLGVHKTDEAKKKMSLAKQGVYKRGKHPKAKHVVCENVIFECIKDCADFYNEHGQTMTNWLNGFRKMPQKFIDMGLRYATEEEISGIKN